MFLVHIFTALCNHFIYCIVSVLHKQFQNTSMMLQKAPTKPRKSSKALEIFLFFLEEYMYE